MASQLESERRDYEAQLELIDTSLRDDPDNAELVQLRLEVKECIQLLDDSLAELRAETQAAALPLTTKAPSPPPAEQKWSRENHPAFKKATVPAVEDKEPEVMHYQVNDTVMAKWLSGDKGFYQARITSVTGSSTAPIYTVRFKIDGNVETMRAKDIRPMPTAQKRKADGTPAAGAATPASSAASPAAGVPPPPASAYSGNAGGGNGGGGNSHNNGIVMSAAADMYPQPAKSDKDDEKPRPKFKKIKATKELEAGKNKWQEFNAKGKFGKGSNSKKDSMFRTPEGPKGRVGFTGSGKEMSKDPTRSRHVYQPNEDVD